MKNILFTGKQTALSLALGSKAFPSDYLQAH